MVLSHLRNGAEISHGRGWWGVAVEAGRTKRTLATTCGLLLRVLFEELPLDTGNPQSGRTQKPTRNQKLKWLRQLLEIRFRALPLSYVREDPDAGIRTRDPELIRLVKSK